MKTTIELAKESGVIYLNGAGDSMYSYTSQSVSISSLEAFRKAVEADFVSRCELKAYISECENFIEYRKEALKELSFEYTLPKDK
jgi:hypothetical protein